MENLFDCVTFFIDCAANGLCYCACRVLFPGLLCGTTYNGKAAKVHCAVKRDDCAAIKRLKNKLRDLCGFTTSGNRD